MNLCVHVKLSRPVGSPIRRSYRRVDVGFKLYPKTLVGDSVNERIFYII